MQYGFELSISYALQSFQGNKNKQKKSSLLVLANSMLLIKFFAHSSITISINGGLASYIPVGKISLFKQLPLLPKNLSISNKL